MPTVEQLRTLVVDDEQPVLDELVYLLRRDDRVASVIATSSGTDALILIERQELDAIFLDIAMPGLSGLDIARLLDKFRNPPRIVFVTAHEQHALDAFELNAVDYILKPIREDRLRESVRRLVESSAPESDDERIAVELAGVTTFVRRSSVALAEAQGDYVRLHTTDGSSHLIRSPLTALAEAWQSAGFVRIHRSYVVNMQHITELRQQSGRTAVVLNLGGTRRSVDVARRHTKDLRERIAAS